MKEVQEVQNKSPQVGRASLSRISVKSMGCEFEALSTIWIQPWSSTKRNVSVSVNRIERRRTSITKRVIDLIRCYAGVDLVERERSVDATINAMRSNRSEGYKKSGCPNLRSFSSECTSTGHVTPGHPGSQVHRSVLSGISKV